MGTVPVAGANNPLRTSRPATPASVRRGLLSEGGSRWWRFPFVVGAVWRRCLTATYRWFPWSLCNTLSKRRVYFVEAPVSCIHRRVKNQTPPLSAESPTKMADPLAVATCLFDRHNRRAVVKGPVFKTVKMHWNKITCWLSDFVVDETVAIQQTWKLLFKQFWKIWVFRLI